MPTIQVKVPTTRPPIPQDVKLASWFVRGWRPMLAWQYIIVCLFDFVLAPILWTAYQGFLGHPLTEWVPITNGIYHMAMAPIVSIYTWKRTTEKLSWLNQGKTDDPENTHIEQSK